MTSSRARAAERQAVLKKLLPLLKKRYKVVLPTNDRPVLETMLYAVCLENQSPEAAEKSYAIFREDFPDLNEARVSQVSEMERGFAGLEDSEWRGFRLRAVLQFVFEKSFTFEFESLKKKTLDLAVKQLARLKQATPFIRSYTLQSAVGAHVLPIDDSMRSLIIWLGLADPNQSAEEISESLKSHVRKADAATFCQALRMAATEDRVALQLPEPADAPPEGYDPTDALARLQALWNSKGKLKPKAPKASSAAKPSAAKPGAAKRKAAKSASKSK